MPLIKSKPNLLQNHLSDVIIGQQIFVRSIEWFASAVYVYFVKTVAPPTQGAKQRPAKLTLIKTIHPT